MTREQLRMFLAVADQGGVRLAAKRLYRTQSAVSKAIRTLEEDVGTPLFSREGYRLCLTAAGKALEPRAKSLLGHFSELEVFARALDQRTQLPLRLALNQICPKMLYVDALRACTSRFPTLEVEILVEAIHGPMQRLLDREVDIAITHHESLHPEIEAQPVGDVEMAAVVRPDCRDDWRAGTLPQVVVRDSARQQLDESYLLRRPGVAWTVNDPTTKEALIRSGLAWGRLPWHRADAGSTGGELAVIDEMPGGAYERVALFALRRLAVRREPPAAMLWRTLKNGGWSVADY